MAGRPRRWIGIVEFEPHGWMRGTFLTVAVDWLWHERDHLAYSVGGRVEHFFGEPPYEDFVETKDEEQFRAAVRGLTMRAAEEVEGYRRRFPTVEDAAGYLRERGDEDFWQAFDAGVACGLLGRAGEATGGSIWPRAIEDDSIGCSPRGNGSRS